MEVSMDYVGTWGGELARLDSMSARYDLELARLDSMIARCDLLLAKPEVLTSSDPKPLDTVTDFLYDALHEEEEQRRLQEAPEPVRRPLPGGSYVVPREPGPSPLPALRVFSPGPGMEGTEPAPPPDRCKVCGGELLDGSWSTLEPVCFSCFRHVGETLRDLYLGLRKDGDDDPSVDDTAGEPELRPDSVPRADWRPGCVPAPYPRLDSGEEGRSRSSRCNSFPRRMGIGGNAC
jgi:hypothetical protein